jgi:hypothetical protein
VSTNDDQVPRKLAYMEAHPDVVLHPPRRSDPMWTAVFDGGDTEIRAVELGSLLDKLETLDRPG